jgi:hypothetical protein
VPAIRLNLRSVGVAPAPFLAGALNHHGPHTPLEWAIYAGVAAALVGVIVAVVRQRDP